MAEPKIESLKERKARLSMESDTLRYHLGLQCNDLAGPAMTLVQGFRVATLGVSLVGITSPWRKARRGRKLFTLPLVLLRMAWAR